MTRTNSYRNFKVLFVDDEEKAQKYFRKACEADFDVLTASSVADATAILDQHSDSIGLLVTDQRMPGQVGTDLLQIARTRYPEIVRILTTAYSDLDSAIEAVNTGAIFQYVAKPWNLRELRGILLRAMDHFQIQRERDGLLCEKLSVLQRMLVLDRARELCVLGAALDGRLRYPLHAVRDYLTLLVKLGTTAPPPVAAGWEDLWASTVSESETAINMTHKLLAVAQPTGFSKVDVSLLTHPAQGQQVEVESRLTEPTSIVADASLLERLRDRLFVLAAVLWPDQPLRLTLERTDDGSESLRLTLASASGAPASDEGLIRLLDVARHARLDADGPWLDLLASHLIVAHHAGAFEIRTAAQEGKTASLVLRLPLDGRATERTDLPDDWLESVLTPLGE